MVRIELTASKFLDLISWLIQTWSLGFWKLTWVPQWLVIPHWICQSNQTSFVTPSISLESKDLIGKRSLSIKLSTEWRVFTIKERKRTWVTEFMGRESHRVEWEVVISTVVNKTTNFKTLSTDLWMTIQSSFHLSSNLSKSQPIWNTKSSLGRQLMRTIEEDTCSESIQVEAVRCMIHFSSILDLTTRSFKKYFLVIKSWKIMEFLPIRVLVQRRLWHHQAMKDLRKPHRIGARCHNKIFQRVEPDRFNQLRIKKGINQQDFRLFLNPC